MQLTERHSLLSRFQAVFGRLRLWPTNGLWPYTPDPAQTGMLIIGEPPAGSPLILAANSRHELARLRRALTNVGGRVLVLDTGGVSLHQRLESGLLTRQQVLSAVELAGADVSTARNNPEQGGEPPPEAETPGEHHSVALMPYPVWHNLFGREPAARIEPGPAEPEALPLYLARGGELTELMKQPHLPLRERLHASLAHGLLLMLIAALPLAFFGLEVLAAGALLVVGASLLLALAYPLRRRAPARVRALLVPGLAALTAMMAPFALSLGTAAAGAIALAAVAVAGWLDRLFQVHEEVRFLDN